MKDEKRRIELLSPAKNLECGISAINNGADAVYIGGPGFGARKQAGNSLADIGKLVNHAHLFGAKVYLALNTLLMDSEIEAANQLIHKAYDTGIDAVIIQDMGLLQTDLPPIPIHASTQTDNRSVEKVKFLEDVGFDQVVLARELSLHQIKSISANTSVALEYFIHGALCVCYSGQCYMSAAINGRSANRGECAQPCRLKYSLRDRNGELLYKDKHLLSLKDLNQTPNIDELLNAGISSFKIEGRLKDKEYVSNITAHYRNQLDKVLDKNTNLARASVGVSKVPFIPAPDKSFNRGFTEYFAHDRKDQVWSIDSPKAIGEKLGKVVKINKDSFVIDTEHELNNGDGLCFYSKRKDLQGLRINTVSGNVISPNQMAGIRLGVEVYRNHDIAFQKEIQKTESKREIGLDIVLKEREKVLNLTITDDSGIITSSELSISDAEPAQNIQKLSDQLHKQLGKLGNTPYYAKNISLDFDDHWFVQMSKITELRRQIIEQHSLERLRINAPKELDFKKTNIKFPSEQLDFKANVTNKKAEEFYKQHGVLQVDWGFEKNAPKHSIEVMRTKHCLLFMDGKCLKHHPQANKLLPLTLFNEKDQYTLDFDCKACEMKIFKD